jgi:hypothetical protein
MKAKARIVLAMVLVLGGCTTPFTRADGVVDFSALWNARTECKDEATRKVGEVSAIRPLGGNWDKAYGDCMNARGYIPTH